jgi:hypothetical protein
MSYDEFWRGDALLVVHYRKAAKLKEDRTNFHLFLQGKYFYDALLYVAPILNAFAKKGTKAHPYHKEPYSSSAKPKEDVSKKEEQQMLNMKTTFEIMAIHINKNLKKKAPPQE